MKKIVGALVFIVVVTKIFGQANKYSIEINPFIRYDKQAYFFSWETTTSGKNYVSPRGLSYGINLNIKKKLTEKNILFIGTGFYKHTVSKIETYNNGGKGNSRLIKYPSPLFIPFYTDKYAYNSLCLNIGYKRSQFINKSYLGEAGLDFVGLYTFSQNYHLTQTGNPNYRKNSVGFLGFIASLDISFLKDFKKFSIGPELKIPILTSIKTDVVFPNENDSDLRTQWFSGLGIGVSINYKLKNLKK